MKNNILLLFTLIASLQITHAQERNHVISFGYGLLSAPDFIDFNFEPSSSVANFGSFRTNNYGKVGTFYGKYERKLGNRIFIGPSFSYQSSSRDYINDNSNQVIDNLKMTYATVMMHLRFNWIQDTWISISSSAGIGGSAVLLKSQNFEDDYKNAGGIAFSADLIQASVGRKLRFHTAIGFGFQGLVHGGLSYNFGGE